MSNASNNHFDHISEIKIPKIISFYNYKGGNISKTGSKKFDHRFKKVPITRNIENHIPNERRDQVH